jgi:2-keto-4-pentenoate hydratase/2-oxohepta-3-ene-1,7-dioic acid hydratase in catechol pathway
MRLAAFDFEGGRRVGEVSVDGDSVSLFDLDEDTRGSGVLALLDPQLGGSLPDRVQGSIPISDVLLQSPIPRPLRNIFCVGKNYYEHAHEFSSSGFDSSASAGAVPEVPIIFSKVPDCVTGCGAAIRICGSVSGCVDYEAELALVIGKGGKNIPAERAYQHVWGYTIVNDVTARDIQGRHKQWLLGKSQDSFCPMGPWLVTADQLDPGDLRVRCWVNGELRQDANTAQLIFDIPTIIATISRGITLIPGDVIATGTPAGVGIGFDPPKYLRDGDRVRVEIDGIGVLENPVTADE